MKKIILNTTIIPMSQEDEIIHGNLIIHNDKIQKIVEGTVDEKTLNEANEIIDGKDYVVLPGLVNAHYHSYANLLKGTLNNLPLELWSLYTTAYGYALEDEDIYNAILLGAGEMLRNGITSCVDHFPHIYRSDAALKAHEDSSMRVNFAPMMHDYRDHHFIPVDLPEEIRNDLDRSKVISPQDFELFFNELFKSWHDRSDKINLMLGPNAPQRCTNEMLLLSERYMKDKKLAVHTHLLETRVQRDLGIETFQGGLLERLLQFNLADVNLSVAHAVWLNEQERELLKEHNISVVHNPASNLVLNSGKAPIQDYFESGVNLALGTDANNCGISNNLFETMRLTIMLNRLNNDDFDNWLKPYDVLKMATIGGVKVMDKAARRGEIKPGYDADLVLYKKNTSSLAMEEDYLSQIVFHETGQSVELVMIAGEWVVKNKKVISFDEKEIIKTVKNKHRSFINKSAKQVKKASILEKYYHNYYKSRNLG